jgi:uncharacterized protein (DUF1697 family)
MTGSNKATALISLLRGVNVGGHHTIRMESVRRVYEGLGFESVRTYVQSGNVVFAAREADVARMQKRIEDALEENFGFRPAVILRTDEELTAVIERNPFNGRERVEPNKLGVLFLAADPGETARSDALGLSKGPEELHAIGRELYIYFPNGMGRPKLSVATLERALRVPGTTRNWNTVTQLAKMASTLV